MAGIDLRAPFWLAAALSFTNFLYGVFILPESLPVERRARFRLRAANPVGAMRFLGSRPTLVTLSLVALFAYLAHDSLPHTFVLYSAYRFAFDERAVGFGLTLAGVSSLVVQGVVVGRVVGALGERGALLVGLLIGLVAQLILGLAPTATLFLAAIPVWSLFGLVTPSLQSIATREVRPTEYGQLQGALGSLRSIATLFTPLLYTQVFAAAIEPLAPFGLPGAPFVLSALFLAAAATISLAGRRSRAAVRPS